VTPPDIFARRAAIGALTFMTAYAWMTFIFLPILLDNFVRDLGLSVERAGLVSSGELAAVALVAMISAATIHRRDKRSLCIAGALLVIGGNVLSALVSDWMTLAISRIVVGSGLGLVVSAVTALPALSEQTEKLYAYGQFGVCVLAAILIFSVPSVAQSFGYRGVYYLEIAMSSVSIACALALPAGVRVLETERALTMPINGPVVSTLVAAILFYCVQTGLWALAGQAGTRIGLSAATVDRWLAISGIVGIGGPLIAIALGARIGLLRPLLLGFGSQAVLGLVLYATTASAGFVLSTALLTGSAMFGTAYILAVAARLDSLGRVASAAGAIMNFGAIGGPFFAATLGQHYGYSAVGYGSALGLAAGFAVILWPTKIVDEQMRVRIGV
jgi:predicted MFS family arabinose efflux permease